MDETALCQPITESRGYNPNSAKSHLIIVIGASAGGVETLAQLVEQLPPDLPAAVLVVVHFPSYSISLLPKILSRSGPLPAIHPYDREPIQIGKIYVAPPDYHLLVRPGYIRLSHGPRENGHRPAVDTLFRSAARSYQQQTVGVILSGTLDDGVAGLRIIQSLGGIAVAQDPKEALFDGMPRAAIATLEMDYVLKIADIAQLLSRLAFEFATNPIADDADNAGNTACNNADNDVANNTKSLVEEETLAMSEIEREEEIVAQDKAILERGGRPGNASTFTCPDCGGVLWELRDDNVIRYRCHTGHAYSLESLIAEQADDLERALWSASRALEEKAALARRMATQARQHNRHRSEMQFLERAQEAAQHADLVRQVILQQTQLKLQDNNGSEGNSAEDETSID